MMTEIDILKAIRPDDIVAHQRLAANIGNVPAFWTDNNKLAPIPWYVNNMMNPTNMIFDVADGKGVIAFLYTQPGWRSQVYAAKWDTVDRAVGDAAFLNACKVAALARDLIVIDAFITTDNEPALAACRRVGMRERGTVKNAVWYNGAQKDVRWFEIDRETLGVDAMS